MRVWLLIIFCAVCASARGAEADDDSAGAGGGGPGALPAQTSRYNRGNQPGRYRDANHRIRLFAVKHEEAAIYDGAGREIGRVRKPVMLNAGAAKEMDVAGQGRQSYAW